MVPTSLEARGVLAEIAERHGTPVYVYDADAMRARYDLLLRAFAGVPLEIHYACKALSNLAILRLFREWGSGLDAVSPQEVELGLLAGFGPDRIIFTSNCTSFLEIQSAVEKGVLVNLDSLPMLEKFGRFYGPSVPCCIRLNPHLRAGGNRLIQTGHADSKFGISATQIDEIARVVDAWEMRVAGLHSHTGSDIGEPEIFLQQAEVLYQAASRFESLEFLDFGGGFKVGYRENEAGTDVLALGAAVRERFREFCRACGKELRMWLEPGKFLVSDAGCLVARVNLVKRTPSKVFAGVDTGLNHFIRPTLYHAYHRISNLSNPGGSPQVYSVVGYICETDTFAEDREIPEIREGDLLCFHNAGAYGFTMSSQYNSRPRPPEVLVQDRSARLIRKRETMEDILRNQLT